MERYTNKFTMFCLAVVFGLITPNQIFSMLASARQAAQRIVGIGTRSLEQTALTPRKSIVDVVVPDFIKGTPDILFEKDAKFMVQASLLALKPELLPRSLISSAPFTQALQDAVLESRGDLISAGKSGLALSSLLGGPVTLSPSFAGEILGRLRKAKGTDFNTAESEALAREISEEHKKNTGNDFSLSDSRNIVTGFAGSLKELILNTNQAEDPVKFITAWALTKMDTKKQFLDMLLGMNKVLPIFKNPSFPTDKNAQQEFLQMVFDKAEKEQLLHSYQEVWNHVRSPARLDNRPAWLQKTAKEFPIKRSESLELFIGNKNAYISSPTSKLISVPQAEIDQSRFKFLSVLPHELTHAEQDLEGRLGINKRADEIEADIKHAIKTGSARPQAHFFLHQPDYKSGVDKPEEPHPADSVRVAYLADLMRQNYKTPESVKGRIRYLNTVAKSKYWQAEEEGVASLATTPEERAAKEALLTAAKELDPLLKQAQLDGLAMEELPTAITQLQRCDIKTKIGAAAQRLYQEVPIYEKSTSSDALNYYKGKEYFSCEITQFGNELVTIGNLVARYIKPELAPAIQAIVAPLKQKITDFFASEFQLDADVLIQEIAKLPDGGLLLAASLMAEMVQNYQPKNKLFLEHFVPKIKERDHAGWVLEQMIKKDNYRPEFLPFIEQLVPKIGGYSLHLLKEIINQANYRAEFEPLANKLLLKITDQHDLKRLALDMIKKENYRTELAPIVDQLLTQIQEGLDLRFLVVDMAKKENYTPDFAQHINKILSRLTKSYYLKDIFLDVIKRENYSSAIAPYLDTILSRITQGHDLKDLVLGMVKRENYSPEIAPILDKILLRIPEGFDLKDLAIRMVKKENYNPEIAPILDKILLRIPEQYNLKDFVFGVAKKENYNQAIAPILDKVLQRLTEPHKLEQLVSDLVKKENYHSAIEPLIEQSLIKITDPQEKTKLTEQLKLRRQEHGDWPD